MGAYLSEPLTTKDSADEDNELLLSGSSSMQGWRISQEDAHNCILNFDGNTSFFAVYDGHGGSEVAQYCSLHLPTFLKTLESYRAGNFEQALKDAFIGFDATLLEEKVIEELKKLSDKTNGEEAVEEDDEEEDEDDNVDDLCKEARMPLNEVLQMYKKEKCNPAISKIKEGNCSKPVSPFLKGKKKELTPTAADEAGPSSSKAGSASSAEADDSTVSSSSTKTESTPEKLEQSTSSGSAKKAEQSDEISDTDGNIPAEPTTKEECAPDSSSSKAGEGSANMGKEATAAPTSNGEAASSKSAVSSSSSAAAQENGVVSSAGGSSDGAGASGSKTASSVDSSSPGSSSSATPTGSKDRKAKNGPANLVDDDSEDDDSETDDEFPPVADANETSSTEDGEEDPYCEEASEEDDEEEGMYEEDEEEDYMNEDDEAFMNGITDEPGKDSGCTAVVALLHDKDLYVANAGDSRCVVCRNGKALEMSFDHKPEDQIEFERIQLAGGRVTLDGRVNGGLNLSRAIGDHGYKMNKKLSPEEQMISALPDIKKITIGAEDDFMVLACDGIWNFMTSEDVVEFVQERISDPTKKLSEICEEMFDYCLAPHTKGDGTGCDNMTAIIVRFKPNFSGAASRKRAVSPEPETTATASDCKKVKTEANASSTSTSSNGNSSEKTPAAGSSNSYEKEAAAAVASIESNTSADCADNTASSST